MPQTPREIVWRTLRFERPARLARDLWLTPWARLNQPELCAELERIFPSDFADAPWVGRPAPRAWGDPLAPGEHADAWGCVLTVGAAGFYGEARRPMLADLRDWRRLLPPYETLPENKIKARDAVNRFCAATDRFVKPPVFPRPWERLQMLRGAEGAMLDLLTPEAGARELIKAIHEFYLAELEFWAATDVNALWFMDDWGSQHGLLIPPPLWRELFKPLYRDYCALAHAHGKAALMHSDGNILDIMDDLIEIGVDALNCQIFDLGLEELARRFKGRVTFWGGIDRLHVLPAPDPQAGRAAVRQVAAALGDPAGGLIAQFELGPGANPAAARAVAEEWNALIA